MTEPSAPTLAWAAGALGVGPASVRITSLNRGVSPWLLRAGDTEAVLREMRRGDPEDRAYLTTEIAAIHVAGEHGIAAPRVIAADVDCHAAVLTTVVPGSSAIPVTATPRRLHAFGAAVGVLAGVTVAPHPHLPPRDRPISGVDFAADRAANGAPPLLARAEVIVNGLPRPTGSALVHGDIWHGNTMWIGDTVTALVDWNCAGVGHPGVDLGSARMDAVLLFGPSAADAVLAGWLGTGPPLDRTEIAYWDAVAALSTPVDMAQFMPVIQGQGRPDLDQATAVARRDAFLADALRLLG